MTTCIIYTPVLVPISYTLYTENGSKTGVYIRQFLDIHDCIIYTPVLVPISYTLYIENGSKTGVYI